MSADGATTATAPAIAMPPRSRVKGSIMAGIGIAVLVDTITPLIWKTAVMRIGGEGGVGAIVSQVIREPLFLLVAGLFVFQFFNWMSVLASADVSFAQPITALSYVAVAIFSAIVFNEKISLGRGLGIGLILAGVYFISTTPHRTTLPEGKCRP